MSKRCELTGTGVQTGHKVSHSNIKTNRRFLPNLQKVTLHSQILKQDFPFRITAASIRSVDHNGGLDGYLLTAMAKNLTEKARKVRRQIQKALAAVPGKEPAPKAKKTVKKAPARKPAKKKATKAA